jgi:ribosomal protein S18 acetylase RimI-like enzyme
VNQDIDITDSIILKSGKLKKGGGRWDLVSLEPRHIPQMLALQDAVLASLPPNQDFLHKKTPKFFDDHFKNNANLVLGIVHDGKLVAQSVIVNPTSKYPDTGMSDMKLDAQLNKVTTVMGVIVDPAYRGNNLMTFMVDEWLASAKSDGRTHAVAEVTVNNHHSWSVFMKEGLQIHSIGHDDSDNSDVYNMHASVSRLIKKRAKADFNTAAFKGANVHMNQLLPQKALLNKGYVGVSFNAANNNITFKAPRRKTAGFKP